VRRVTISHLKSDGSIAYGMPLTTHQILDTAIARFDAAIAATTDPDMTAFAAVGKARALIDSAGFAAAGALAATVPPASRTYKSTPKTPIVRTTECSTVTSPTNGTPWRIPRG